MKRQFISDIERKDNLRVVISTTGDMNMYLGVGRDEVNSALHDASILVEKVIMAWRYIVIVSLAV